jgi:hypothetical protein
MKRYKVILAAAIVAAATGSALAIPTLIVSDGVTSTSLTSASGIVSYFNSSFDSAWSLTIISGTTKPQAGYASATSPNMDLQIQASSLSLSPVRNLTISFSENFYGPTTGTFDGRLTGNVVSGTGQNVTYSTFFDAGNVTSATTSLLTTTGSLPPPNYNPPDQFSGPFSHPLYSLTQVVTINGTPAATPTGSYTLDATLSLVPEPSGCCLFLSGAAIFGLKLWRRRK